MCQRHVYSGPVYLPCLCVREVVIFILGRILLILEHFPAMVGAVSVKAAAPVVFYCSIMDGDVAIAVSLILQLDAYVEADAHSIHLTM